MTATLIAGIVFLSAFVWLALEARRQHREAMKERHRLLDTSRDLLADCRISLAPDQFPIANGTTSAGRRVKMELVADTLIARRLPQLWLKITLVGAGDARRASLGALARPTGAEYYSVVHDMPEWLAPPATGTPLLMRGSQTATAAEIAIAADCFETMFADPKLKEAAILPRATRIVYQAAEGERAAHLFLRQAKFATAGVSAETIMAAIRMAEELEAALAETTGAIEKAA